MQARWLGTEYPWGSGEMVGKIGKERTTKKTDTQRQQIILDHARSKTRSQLLLRTITTVTTARHNGISSHVAIKDSFFFDSTHKPLKMDSVSQSTRKAPTRPPAASRKATTLWPKTKYVPIQKSNGHGREEVLVIGLRNVRNYWRVHWNG